MEWTSPDGSFYDALPDAIRRLVGRCEINEHTFDNDDMSVSLKFGEMLVEAAGSDGRPLRTTIRQLHVARHPRADDGPSRKGHAARPGRHTEGLVTATRCSTRRHPYKGS